jgi:hypothetical protein
MFLRSTGLRVTVAGLVAFALAATASPAAADAVKPDRPRTGTLQAHGDAILLENGVEQTLIGKRKYAYDQELIYWSAVAVRSEGGLPRLSLFADPAREELLAKSRQEGTETEFVVVDSNHAPIPATYFAVARSKGGESTIELDNDAVILFDDDPMDVPMAESDVVIVTDVFLDLDVEYVLKVTGDGDSALFLMQSEAETSSTWYQSRADAVATADDKGVGMAEKITFTGTDDWYALVLINNSGAGTYTLTKSPAA